jgi:pyruvate formate lyase activating enzyme
MEMPALGLAEEQTFSDDGISKRDPRGDRGIVFDIMRFSTHDGPGIRTTVFLKGCPLSCAWCHNPESQRLHPEVMLRPNLCIACLACVAECPQGAIAVVDGVVTTDRSRCMVCGTCAAICPSEARAVVGREMTAREVLAQIEKDSPFYEESGGGVTFSGGDPLAQVAFLKTLLRECKRREIHTAVETAGYAPWQAFERIRSDVDLFLFDLKVIDPQIHRQVTGVANAVILSNLRRLAGAGQALIVRVPLIPGINDGESALRELGEFAAALPGCLRVDLLPYHRAGEEKYHRLGRPYLLEGLASPDEAQVNAAAQVLKEFGLIVHVGG